MTPSEEPLSCPCGSGQRFVACCGPVVQGEAAAPTAEALMRSRFTAFATGNAGYLAASWAPETRPSDLHVVPERRWVRLEIIDTVAGRQLDTDGIVEFRAHWEQGAASGVLAERSRFRRDAGRWLYVDRV